MLDKRKYTSVARLLTLTGLNRYVYSLISESPDKLLFLMHELGIQINSSHKIKREISIENAGEYLAKVYDKGYSLTDQELQDVYQAIFSADEIPGRVLSLLCDLTEDISRGQEFRANPELLHSISKIPEKRGIKHEFINGMDLLKDAEAYDEYQTEVEISADDVSKLFEAGILLSAESLRYEENHFYDLTYFEHVPARSLKIRYAYRLNDRNRPFEIKFIYKVPIKEKVYRIKSVVMSEGEVANLIRDSLRDRKRHLLPVLTHSVRTIEPGVTTLIKRYSSRLRTLSLMGHETKVRELVGAISKNISAREIDDPSNYRYLDPTITVGFDYAVLVEEELALFRPHCFG